MPAGLNPLTIRPDRLERLRRLCLALPEASEKVAWGDPTWRVRDKIFAMQKGNYAGGRPSVWLKVSARDVLLESDPERFFVPPYVGPKGWIGIYMDRGRPPWPLIVDLIEQSYRLIAPRRLVAQLTEPARASRPAKARRKKRKAGR